MPTREFTIEEVTHCSKNALTRLAEDLPHEIAVRLKIQRKAARHGTEMRMFLHHITDAHQPSVLKKDDFNYAVIYDPKCRYHQWRKAQGGPCNLLVRFYCNRIKIYDKKEVVVQYLWDQMATAEKELYGFQRFENNQMIGLFRFFDAECTQSLEENIYQGFLELIPYWHPIYANVMDHYGLPLTREQVKEVIASRARFNPGIKSAYSSTEYCRHVPTRIREDTFARDGHKCVFPGCDATTELHADHILPVSKGGLTTLDNLQTLCAQHNLSKGNRDSTDYRKA